MNKVYGSIVTDIMSINEKLDTLEKIKVNKSNDIMENIKLRDISIIPPKMTEYPYKLVLPSFLGQPFQVMILDEFQNLKWTNINPLYDQLLNTNNIVKFQSVKVNDHFIGNLLGKIIDSEQLSITKVGLLDNLQIKNKLSLVNNNNNINIICPNLENSYDLVLPNTKNNSNQLLISDNSNNLKWINIKDLFMNTLNNIKQLNNLHIENLSSNNITLNSLSLTTLNCDSIISSQISGLIKTNNQPFITTLGLLNNLKIKNYFDLTLNEYSINIRVDELKNNYSLILPNQLGQDNQVLILQNKKLSWIDFPNQSLSKNNDVEFKSINGLIFPDKKAFNNQFLSSFEGKLIWKSIIEYNQSLNINDNVQFNEIKSNILNTNILKIKNLNISNITFIKNNYLCIDENNNVQIKTLEQSSSTQSVIKQLYEEIVEVKSDLKSSDLLAGIITIDSNNLKDGKLKFPSAKDIVANINTQLDLNGYVIKCLINNYSGPDLYYIGNEGLEFITPSNRIFIRSSSSRLVYLKIVNLNPIKIIVV